MLVPLTVATVGTACSRGADDATSSDEVTSVEDSSVKAQAIGNCWLYATAAWAESLHKGATARDVDISEAYWSYWYWYDQIVRGDISARLKDDEAKISPGGWWGRAVELIHRYGWMYEGDFIPDPDARAKRHKTALTGINASLGSGALASPGGRSNPKLVRAELARVWELAPTVVSDLENVFGPALDAAHTSGTLETLTDRASKGELGVTRIHAPQELAVLGADGKRTVTLSDVIGTRAADSWVFQGLRVGPEAWSSYLYEWDDDDSGRAFGRAVLKNVQDALNRRLPVPLAWSYASNPTSGVYRGSEVTDQTVRGLHESLLVDYEVENVAGFGTLPIGVRETRPAAREAALDATVTFFRIKNSWGTSSPTRKSYLPDQPGYNDIFVDYLNRPKHANDPNGARLGVRMTLPPELRFPIPPAS